MIRGWTVRLISLFILVITTNGSPASTRHRRDLIDFGDMVKAATGKSGLAFLDYGRYCGLGGKGNPNDPIDECCMIHDKCYNWMKTTGGCSIFTTKYSWYINHLGIQCEDSPDYCAKGMCECDKEAATCFSNNLSFYSSFGLNYVGAVVNDVRHMFQRLF